MGAYIPERILDEIRFRNDIVEVISAYVPLKRTGSTYKACCPFHKEKTPSFNVNPNMQIFKCFGCGEGGDVIGFMMKHQGMDFVTAAKMLADKVGIAVEVEADSGEGAQRKALYEIHHGIAQFYRRCLEHYVAAEKARAYVEDRGLGGEVAEAFQIGYAPAGWGNAIKWGEKYGFSVDQLEMAGVVLRSSKPEKRGDFYDRFRDRLMFPIHDSQGRVIAFSARILLSDPKQPKYINSPESLIFSKSRVLYGLDKARRHIVNTGGREAIICEGQIDVVRCHQCGFPTAVASQGTAFTEDHVHLLKNYADSIVLAFDSDSAGQAAAIKTAHLFMKAGMVVRVAALPTGEDPDSFLRTRGAEEFRQLIEKAGSVTAFQISILSAQEQDIRGIAATARISKAVLETLCHSPNAVQRERMLQEASALLGLPQRVLEADLDVMDAEQKRQAERHAGRVASRAAGTREPTNIPVLPDPSPDTANFIEGDAYEEEPPEEVMALLRHSDNSSAGKVPVEREAIMNADERSLCEHLVQGEDDPTLARLVEENLLLTMISSPLCRRLMSLSIEAFIANSRLTETLEAQEGGEAQRLNAFVETLRALPVRIKGTDSTRHEAVQDLILGFWRRHLQLERKRLSLPAAKGCSAADGARRIQITMDIKSLQHWETGQDVILIERAMLEEAAEGAEGGAAGSGQP